MEKKRWFSDGVSKLDKPWYEIISEYTMSNFNLSEKDWYKYVFDNYYPNSDNAIPHYWMPKWCGDIQNPSGRLILD